MISSCWKMPSASTQPSLLGVPWPLTRKSEFWSELCHWLARQSLATYLSLLELLVPMCKTKIIIHPHPLCGPLHRVVTKITTGNCIKPDKYNFYLDGFRKVMKTMCGEDTEFKRSLPLWAKKKKRKEKNGQGQIPPHVLRNCSAPVRAWKNWEDQRKCVYL